MKLIRSKKKKKTPLGLKKAAEGYAFAEARSFVVLMVLIKHYSGTLRGSSNPPESCTVGVTDRETAKAGIAPS